jgi:hypothetical protein
MSEIYRGAQQTAVWLGESTQSMLALECALAQSNSLWARVFYRILIGIHRLYAGPNYIRDVPGTFKIADRGICTTEYGLTGLASKLAKPGDYIALFQGGSVPLVIRPRGDDWELIGDCYVHGIMTGKVWELEACQEMWFV